MKKVLTVVLLLLLSFAIVSCKDDSIPVGASDNVITWQSASDHIGETVTVEGPVVDTKYSKSSKGSPTFLDIGKDYPSNARFSVVIWGEDRDSFSEAPEDMYNGKTVQVSGKIVEYDGVAEIQVSSEDKIKIVD